MKKILIALGFVAITALSGCAVVPAYSATPYYEPAPYYRPRPYYGPPVMVMPAPVVVPRYRHHDWDR